MYLSFYSFNYNNSWPKLLQLPEAAVPLRAVTEQIFVVGKEFITRSNVMAGDNTRNGTKLGVDVFGEITIWVEGMIDLMSTAQ